MSKNGKIIIIGGGASGLAAALAAAKECGGRCVTVLERLDRVGKKLLATGNGRCNLTNTQAGPRNYHGEAPNFVRPALESFGPAEALDFFRNLPKIRDKIQTLFDVGLGYVKLGQSSTTLSGGEAQRVKLATELARRSTGATVYVLDEPTTGLHTADVQKLITILDRLTDAGNTVVVIEHNLDVIKVADHIIDLGPEGGDGGGAVVFAGTPEDCANCAESATGEYLKKVLA